MFSKPLRFNDRKFTPRDVDLPRKKKNTPKISDQLVPDCLFLVKDYFSVAK
ncbi:hypothetical protein CHCC20335_2602 [Bacillus paralicheniformis]|nr:hypothetical protein CHCC20335_2602 [Bacillus paralicheniformis]